MRRYEKNKVVEVIQSILVELKCDICGREPVDIGESSNWNHVGNQHITIRNAIYDLDGESTEEEFDCCPDCWTKHIKPLFNK